MNHTILALGPLGCNCVILSDPESREALVVDPGDELETIAAALAAGRLHVTTIVLTHAHIDHLGAAAGLARLCRAPILLHAAERSLLEMLPLQARLVGLPAVEVPSISGPLSAGDRLTVGRFALDVLSTPGHSPGSVSLACAEAKLCVCGDTLFAEGVGRTDLWGGNAEALQRSIREQLYVLDAGTKVLPGHGPATTIAHERVHNPFVRA